MTGEISLQGLTLPVGGIQEKCIAAHRNGIKNVILPMQNKDDIKDIPEDVRGEMTIHLAENIQKYLELALEKELDREFMKQQMLNRGVHSKMLSL